MDLREYLFRQNMTVTEFAEICGCTRDHLSRIIWKKSKPSKKLAEIISIATHRKVSANELLNIDEKKEKD